VHLLALDVMLVKPMMGRLPIVGNLDSLGLRLQKQTLHLLTVNRVPAVVVSIIAAPRRQDRHNRSAAAARSPPLGISRYSHLGDRCA